MTLDEVMEIFKEEDKRATGILSLDVPADVLEQYNLLSKKQQDVVVKNLVSKINSLTLYHTKRCDTVSHLLV